MAKDLYVATGTVAFESLHKTDVYNGKDTGKYNVVITLDDDSALDLENKGVKLKDYEGTAQRKFATGFKVDILDSNGDRYDGMVTRGSKIRVLYSTGKPNPMYGVPTYLEKVKVLELAEPSMSNVEGF